MSENKGLEVGLSFEQEIVVTEEMTAKYLGSGAVEVYATPMMILLMENTAAACVAPYLDPGCVTVGTKLQIEHCAATPVGLQVRCKAVLTEIDGRALRFQVEAFDTCERIGFGSHERFVVTADRFNQKAKKKIGG